MIRGYFVGPPGRRRPYVDARIRADLTGLAREVSFLIDTGADRGLLSSRDAGALGLAADRLPRARSVGVGGAATTALAETLLTLGTHHFRVTFRVLAGDDGPQRRSQRRVPSLLGGDILSQFGLYIEEHRGLVLLFEPEEAAGLDLP
jgi:hypothetical protein